jgi:L-amino acid N-acyltransferase YncA
MLETRAMQLQDLPACVDIVNHIIAQGGSTAYETPFDLKTFEAEYLHRPPVVNVVLHNKRVVGFQAAFDYGDRLYSIGSFTDRVSPVRGAGKALFDKTLADCRARGGDAILARITSDNIGGLAFYSRIGFADWDIVRNDHQRPDGHWVDRVIKRYPL